MPAPITLARPDISTALSTIADVPIAWSGGEPNASVIIEVIGDTQTICTFDASAGAGTIPRAALSAFAGHTTTFQWQQQRDVVANAGSFPVHLMAVVTISAQVAWN